MKKNKAEIISDITTIIDEVNINLTPSRETSLTITKLQEAIFWLNTTK